MSRIIKPMADNGPIPDEVLKEIVELLAGPDGAAVKTKDGWTYSKPDDAPIDGGTIQPKS